MNMRLVTIIILLVAFAATAFAVDQRAGDEQFSRKTSETTVHSDDRAEHSGLLSRILPTRDTMWSYLVTAALVTVIAIVWWIFFAVSLKGACWFSLVEVSMFRCGTLAFLITALSLICFGTAAYFQGSSASIWSPSLSGGLTLLSTALVYLAAAIVFTKLMLKCKWRSVITVWIMSTFVACAFVCCTYIGLLASLPAQAAPIP